MEGKRMENIKNNDITEQEKEITYKKNLSMSEKTFFIVEMSSMVVSNQFGYLSILKELAFDYYILKYFTDAVLSESKDNINLRLVENSVNNNKEIIGTIKEELAITCEALLSACDDAIEYRKASMANCEKISELSKSIEALSNKPDYFSELLISLKGFLDKAKDIEVDMDIVNKLADIIPVLSQMGGEEVAKTIIREFHED